jgi:hypothetical protein
MFLRSERAAGEQEREMCATRVQDGETGSAASGDSRNGGAVLELSV